MTQNGKCNEEIKRTIRMAKKSFSKLEHVLRNTNTKIGNKKASVGMIFATSPNLRL